MPKLKVALIVGAGLSCEAGFPSTKQVVESFITEPDPTVLTPQIEREISKHLRKFWADVFGYGHQQRAMPSLEDHFTVLDSAANTGHHLGPDYEPRKLRAIRRLSIHRIFQILDRPGTSEKIDALLRRLHMQASLFIVSTNWDILVEKQLREINRVYGYGPDVETLPHHGTKKRIATQLLKLHGSANWIYCDSCRKLSEGHLDRGKLALRDKVFIREEDFALLGSTETMCNSVERVLNGIPNCDRCGSKPSARVATFSYHKDFSLQQFQAIWQKAHSVLRESDVWLFVGYSMPEADFEFRHLLKSAQLSNRASEGNQKRIQVVLKGDCEAGLRFQRFFGLEERKVYQMGLAKWVDDCLKNWVEAMRASA